MVIFTIKLSNFIIYFFIVQSYSICLSTSSNSFLSMIVMSSSTDCYLVYKIEIIPN